MSAVKAFIQSKLREIEREEDCRILLAVESGSRAWGFASPDSDYDVRFIYVRAKERYLSLERRRDVIELPINDELDINGWDADKALRLIHKSNPTVFEWFASPVVYLTTPEAALFRTVMLRYFSPKSGASHYLSMAARNAQNYLLDDMVKVKKYFYVLRPVLACRWILEKGTPPPVPFSELMEHQLPDGLTETVNRLLEFKRSVPEVKMIPKIDSLNRYLRESIDQIRTEIPQLPREAAKDWNELDRLFLRLLGI